MAKNRKSTLKNKINLWLSMALMLVPGYRLQAQRTPVLPQIDLPHNYYYRELYLPQLTSGPSSVSWSPDAKSLVYSMAGSLWRQEIGTERAWQITDGPGYDYQPDWSPDGDKIIFVRYDGSSIELMLLHIPTDQVIALTANQAVNVEPRWSPDSRSLAFVSTESTGHFLLHKARFSGNKLHDIKVLTPDRKSTIKRYYYSEYDHAINPAWSPDGKRIYFVSNQEVAHGTGNIVFINLEKHEQQIVIQKEETSWRARPDITSDGSRMIYSSYLGRNWHQLWLLPSEGGYPFPLTYGDYDNTAPRWSPDAQNIAFISNREGNTGLWIVNAYSGQQKKIVIRDLQYKRPRVQIYMKTTDENGNEIPARLSVTDTDEQFYAPFDSWIHADDAGYPLLQKYESHYFHSPGTVELKVPPKKIMVQAARGPDFEKAQIEIDASEQVGKTVEIKLKKIQIPVAFGKWWSGDLHVHMNYTGHYRNTPDRLKLQAGAENLDFVYNLVVNKEQRIPDIDYFEPSGNTSDDDGALILQGQEYHTSFWGHLGLLNLTQYYLLPDYAGYPYTAVESLFPHNSYVADRVHEQNGLVGYVHPFLDAEIFPEQSENLTSELPLDAALGKVDYYELIGFAHHKASEAVWYNLLNCGLRIPAGAGTDAMANYASLRGPVGLNRVYVAAVGVRNHEDIIAGIKAGKSFVTNGPLVGLKIDEAGPGEIIQAQKKNQVLNFNAFLRSYVPVRNLELVWNGKVVKKYDLRNDGKNADFSGSFKINGPGWVVVRAWSKEAHPDLPDFYPYASTNPIYVSTAGSKLLSKSSGNYFLHWLDRLEKAAQEFQGYRTENEKINILNDINAAKKFYQNCVAYATIP